VDAEPPWSAASAEAGTRVDAATEVTGAATEVPAAATEVTAAATAEVTAATTPTAVATPTTTAMPAATATAAMPTATATRPVGMAHTRRNGEQEGNAQRCKKRPRDFAVHGHNLHRHVRMPVRPALNDVIRHPVSSARTEA